MKTKNAITPLFNISVTDTFGIKNVPDPQALAFHTIVVGDDGSFYCSDEFNHRIIVLDNNFEFAKAFGCKGDTHGQFWYPRGIAIADNNGAKTLFVCDSWNHRIQQFDLDGNFISTFGSIGNGNDNFDEPVAILTDRNSDLLILDRNNGRVKRHTQNGEFISAFGKLIDRNSEDRLNDPETILFAGESPTQGYLYPEAFSMLDDGTLLIADTGNRRICHVTVTGEPIYEARLDVDGEHPYSYPNLLTPLNQDIVLLGGINTPLKLVNLRLPWRSTPVGPGSDLTQSLACLTEKVDDGSFKLTLVDCSKGIATRFICSFRATPDENDALISFPEDSQLQDPPNRWTEIECDKWHSYLIAKGPDENSTPMARKFIGACRSSASSAARALLEVEGKICNMMAEYYEVLDNLRKANLERQNENKAQLRLQSLNLRYLEAKRNQEVYREIVIKTIFKAIDLVTNNVWKNELAKEAVDIAQLMKSEYEQRLKDYSEIIKWFKDNSGNPEKLNILAFSNASTVISFLLAHLSYIEKSLSRLDNSFTPKPVESRWLMSNLLLSLFGDVRGIPTTIFSVIGQVCVELGYIDTAMAIYSYGIAQNDELKLTYASCYCELLLSKGKKNDALKVFSPLLGEVKSNRDALRFASILQDCGDFQSAKKLIDRFSEELQDSEDFVKRWETVKRRQRLLSDTSVPAITLSTGQSTSDLPNGSGLPDDNYSLRYIQSVQMNHPATGEPIQPYLILPINDSQLIVVNNLTAPRELFLYTLGDGCRPLLENPAFITGIDLTPAGDLIYTSFRNNKNREAGSSIKIVKIGSGKTRDITDKVIPNPDFVSYKIHFMPSGDLIVFNIFSGEILLFNEILGKCEHLGVVPPGFNEVSSFGYKLVFSNRPDDKIYVYDIHKKSGHFIGNELIVGPMSGALINESMLAVATETGLQIYRNDKYLYQINQLTQEDKTFILKECFCISSGMPFGEGDLLISDYMNKAVHLLARR